MEHNRIVTARAALIAFALLVALTVQNTAQAATALIVAIGDSNVVGRYVSSSENYTAKLERALRAKGYDVRVANEGINGDTTAGVLSRIDSAIPKSTRLAIVWVRINDLRAGVSPAKVELGRQEIAHRLRARGDQGLAAWTATRACFSTAVSDRG
jgi:acyl-CoA thioesterase-1